MRLVLHGDKNTEVEGEKIIIQYRGKCMKLHPRHPLCLIHKNKKGEIIEDVPFSEEDTKKIKNFFEKIKIRDGATKNKKQTNESRACLKCNLSKFDDKKRRNSAAGADKKKKK